MKFKVDKSVFQKLDNVCFGIVVVKCFNNMISNTFVQNLFNEIIKNKELALSGTNINEIEDISYYRNAFTTIDINANKYMSSIESLLTRIAKGKSIPKINTAVDLANYISIKHNVAVGAHDIDTFIDDLCIRFAKQDDDYISLKEESIEKAPNTEIVYSSGNQIRTRRWIWRQCDIGRITNESSNILFPIDGFIENKISIINARNELAKILKEHFDCEVKVGFIDKTNRTFEIGELSQKEQVIEDIIKVMLKGTAEHTDIDDIREKLAHVVSEGRPLRIKLGLDPSAPDIHLGHAVVLRKIKQLQDLGHNAIIIIGDFTGKIGDPTGKSKTRKQLTNEEVLENAKTYNQQIFKILDPNRTTVKFNSEWLGKLSLEDGVNLAAKCTVARILERDEFNKRYTNHQPIYVHEFFYPLMQAYDSVAIQADLELGGTDQVFNVLMGRNIQRNYGQEPQITLFMPILEGIDGIEKMSKSLGNYIGINESPDSIYTKVMQIPDTIIIKYFELCTDLHPDELENIQIRLNNGENPRDIKMELAKMITSLYQGETNAIESQKHFVEAFQKNIAPQNIPDIIIFNTNTNNNLLGECLLDSLLQLERFNSKNEIRRLFNQNAVFINNKKITDPKLIESLNTGDIIQIGKGKFYRVIKKIILE